VTNVLEVLANLYGLIARDGKRGRAIVWGFVITPTLLCRVRPAHCLWITVMRRITICRVYQTHSRAMCRVMCRADRTLRLTEDQTRTEHGFDPAATPAAVLAVRLDR
jgi:hypothetical protein